jgi:Ca2+-binding RTX toxin-like protein
MALGPQDRLAVAGYEYNQDYSEEKYYVARYQLDAGAHGDDSGVAIINGVLTITGTAGGDTLAVDPGTGGNVTVWVNATPKTFAPSTFKSILVNAKGGDDKVLIDASITNPAKLLGGAGNDLLVGGAGNDTLDGGAGADTMKGGKGFDTVDYSSRTKNLTVTVGSGANDGEAAENDNVWSDVEKVIAGSGNDLIHGYAYGGVVVGGSGNDTLYGGGGKDALFGGSGQDKLFGDSGNDYLEGGPDRDTLDGGFGTDSGKNDGGDLLISIKSIR